MNTNGDPLAASDDTVDGSDDRVAAAMREYLAEVEAGRTPNRRALMSRYADVAGELSKCLSGLAFIRAGAANLRSGSGDTTPIIATAPDEAADMGRPLGDFRLIREIGRGGMGVVYEATQISLERRVAVKVLSMAAALDSRHLRRFRTEAQAAAQLHHTNIVPVYAVGCERSVHYYAMQLIDGRSLAELIGEMRAAEMRAAAPRQAVDAPPLGARDDGAAPRDATDASTSPPPVLRGRDREAAGIANTAATPALPRSTGGGSKAPPNASPAPIVSRSYTIASSSGGRTSSRQDETVNAATLPAQRAAQRRAFYRTVARLGVQAAEALDYAHRAGVVHRDVKPANLLLDYDGTLWVTDFGLALLQSDQQLTQAGETVGTLQYMSPEQASGRAVVLDQRTDIYSLGVTLYELLTLQRAFTGTSREQLLYQIQYDEPKPPRSIDPSVPPELATILTTAMAKDPADRYATARALAEDLGRFLREEPIQARRPPWRSRVVKWARRHRTLVAAGIVVAVLGIFGLLVSTVLIAREQGKTQAAYNREREKVVEANNERALANQQRLLADQQRALAERSFAQARDAVRFLGRVATEDMADIPQAATVRKEMLEAALDYYQGFLEDHGSDPAVGEELAEAEANVASLLAELDAFEALDRVQSRVRLLNEPSVIGAIDATPDQLARAKTLGASFPNRMRDAFGRSGGGAPDASRSRDGQAMTPKRRSELLATVAADVEAELAGILSGDQSTRLAQISRQVRGPAAFSDPEVVAALVPTREQREMVRRIQSDARRAKRELDRRQPPGDRRHDERSREPDRAREPDRTREMDRAREIGDRTRDIRLGAVDQILAHLTPSQVRTWQSLAGDPFTGALLSDQPPVFPQPNQPNRPGPGPNNPDDRRRPPEVRPPIDRRDRPREGE